MEGWTYIFTMILNLKNSMRNLPITYISYSNSFESLLVEVWRKNYTNIKYVIGNIYRLPWYDFDNLISFSNEYIDILNTLQNLSPTIICSSTMPFHLVLLQNNTLNKNLWYIQYINWQCVYKYNRKKTYQWHTY